MLELTRASPCGCAAWSPNDVGDDLVSVVSAARRFLDQQNQMDRRVHNLFAGRLRPIIGNMTRSGTEAEEADRV